MAKLTLINHNFEEIIVRLNELLGKEITMIVKEKTKSVVKKAILTNVSDNLFCVDIKLGKYNVVNNSYTFIELKTNKVFIKELADIL